MEEHAVTTRDPWEDLKRFTDARIALGRSGISLPTRHLLDFQLAHARARDAVHLPLDCGRVQKAVEALGLEVVRLHSAAGSRTVYLQRPDLGRRLRPEDARALAAVAAALPAGESGFRFDLALVVADGLSSLAVHASAASLVGELLPKVKNAG